MPPPTRFRRNTLLTLGTLAAPVVLTVTTGCKSYDTGVLGCNATCGPLTSSSGTYVGSSDGPGPELTTSETTATTDSTTGTTATETTIATSGESTAGTTDATGTTDDSGTTVATETTGETTESTDATTSGTAGETAGETTGGTTA